ncbi:MAG: tRNA lysidine(34) synthetase TilS [Gemmatimonadaceae bacterium]
MTTLPEHVVLESARTAAWLADSPLLLAVSGGLDSMVLLHAMTTVARGRIAAVATFDHGTGEEATRAAAHVLHEAGRLGVPVTSGVLAAGADASDGLEAMWRDQRYRFLRGVATHHGARIATAHTADDQIETVLMRVMRGSGARGLAGLAAPCDVVRPFLGLSRATLESFARRHEIAWVEDPSNSSARFLRNRIRREILPALRRVDKTIDSTLLETARASAALRVDVERFIDEELRPTLRGSSTLFVGTTELARHDRDSLGMLWGALAGRVGLALDRRGTQRCVAFTMKKPSAGIIPLSGGWSLEARRGALVLGRSQIAVAGLSLLPEDGALEWNRFRFSIVSSLPDDSGWSATLPAMEVAQVRCWRPGDRLGPTGGSDGRRVKRYLSDAGLVGSDRAAWPVVILGDEVVWIPGVRRSDAATVRSGGPARHFICERTHR